MGKKFVLMKLHSRKNVARVSECEYGVQKSFYKPSKEVLKATHPSLPPPPLSKLHLGYYARKTPF